MSRTDAHIPIRLGLADNLPQFTLLVAVNALVGGMVGQERTVLPLLAEAEFELSAYSAMLTFIAAFGLTKAPVNYFAGTLADRFGRKPVLLAGWLFAVPVPLLLIWAPTWGWVVFANVLLGVNQGLARSVTVIMKIDLVGPTRRGTAMGFNEAAGYGAVALAAWATGAVAETAGLRPAPFLLGLAFAALGLGLSAVCVRETAGYVAHEAANHAAVPGGYDGNLTARQVLALGTWRDRSLSAASQAGLVNNLNEGMAWGLFAVYFAAGGLDLATVGLLTAITPAVWGIGQLGTGALSDRVGRKWLIAGGQFTEAAGLLVIASGHTFAVWAAGGALFGAGTAMAYPTLLAAVGDVAHPTSRGAAVGVYRVVARHRLRRRRRPRRRGRRPVLHHHRHRRGRSRHRCQRHRRRRPYAGDPPERNHDMTSTSQATTRLSAEQIRALDPYALMGVLGKRVIHPGGRRATEQLLDWAAIAAGERVLDAGCGVATTAIEVVRRHGATVTGLDIAPVMLERARHNVHKAGFADNVRIEEGDIQNLAYPDATFDCVLAEAVTMFVDRPRAARELVRVCRPGGRVLATEFYWLRPPSDEARRVFLGEVCPGLSFDSVDDWEHLYAHAGLSEVRSTTGAFDMLTVRGFVHDEGIAGCLRFLARSATRASAIHKLAWLMPRMARAVPYLGYIIIAGTKPNGTRPSG